MVADNGCGRDHCAARSVRSVAMIADDRRAAVIADDDRPLERPWPDWINNHGRLAVAFARVDDRRLFTGQAVMVVVVVVVAMMIMVVMIVAVMIIMRQSRIGLHYQSRINHQ